MKIIALIITIIGMLITGISSLGIVYSIHTAIESMKNAGNAGIGIFASWISTTQTLSYVNIFGAAILFLGVVLTVIVMFTGRKQQVMN
ncbi:hypothetical protein BH10ACI1_BH10ACI1_26320 [soil metagenome]